MSSTSSQVSVVSPSDLNEPECEQSPSAKLTHSAVEFSPSTGQASPSARTSRQWRLTELQKCQAAALYEQGLSLGKVAIQFGVSRQSMWDVLRRRIVLRDRLEALPRLPQIAKRKKRLKTLRRYRARARRLTRADILAVKARDLVCKMCGLPGTDIDHIIPVSRGGQSELANLQLLCRPCHHQKSRSDRKEV